MVSREIFIKNKMNRLCEYVRANFDNKGLIEEMNSYAKENVLDLVFTWNTYVKDTDAFISGLEKRYKINLTEEQHKKIYQYLDVLNI